MQSRPAGKNCFVVFAFMHGHRIKDDKSKDHPLLLCGKNNEDDFRTEVLSLWRLSLFLSRSQCFRYMTELSPTTTCRWRDDTFLEKIEPSVIIRSVRVVDSRASSAYSMMRGSESKRRWSPLPDILYISRKLKVDRELPECEIVSVFESLWRRDIGRLAGRLLCDDCWNAV